MRTDRRQPAGIALLLVAFGTCTCTSPLPAEATDRGPVRPVGCAAEAALLANRLALRSAPDPAAAATMVLMPGVSIYRCERRGAFLGVMFPEEGGRVDCSTRPPGRECPTGWTDAPLDIEITG
jgi:hypothetical protein